MTVDEQCIYVSVIVPTYNQSNFISQALDSILMQKTNFRFEVLIGDDGSADGTREILTKYQREYPGVVSSFFSECNQGAVANICRMLPYAQGKYLAGCDGDDYWCDEYKLQKQVEFLENHPDYSACSHDVLLVDDKNYPLKTQKLNWISKNRDYILERDFKGIFLPGHPSSLVRRNYFKENALDASIYARFHKMVADRTTAVIWGMHGNIYRMKDKMGCYRVRSCSNLTTMLYSCASCTNLRQDFDYSKRLYQYISDNGIDASFDYHFAEMYLSALLKFKKETKEFRKEILDLVDSKVLFNINILHIAASRAKDKLFSRRVNI